MTSLSVVKDNSTTLSEGNKVVCFSFLQLMCVLGTIKYLFGVMTHEIQSKFWFGLRACQFTACFLVSFYGEQHILEIVY